jgi:putative transposase
MKHYRKSIHSIFDLKVHFVWITKYRKPVLFGNVAARLRDLIREVCQTLEVEILKGHVSKDHVHLFVSMPPHLSVSDLVKHVKGKTSRKILSENRQLAKQFWGRHLWARG